MTKIERNILDRFCKVSHKREERINNTSVVYGDEGQDIVKLNFERKRLTTD